MGTGDISTLQRNQQQTGLMAGLLFLDRQTIGQIPIKTKNLSGEGEGELSSCGLLAKVIAALAARLLCQ